MHTDKVSVNPLVILVETILPSYAHDARDMVDRIMRVAKSKNEEIDIQDGFDLYREMVDIRSVYLGAVNA
jgi:hypothetical protein